MDPLTLLVLIGMGAVALGGKKTSAPAPVTFQQAKRFGGFTATTAKQAPAIVPPPALPGRVISVQGPATLARKPNVGSYNLSEEKAAAMTFKSVYDDETARYGGIDIICSTPHFWKTISRFRPRRRLIEMSYPSVTKIEDHTEFDGYDPIYSIAKTYFSDGATTGEHLIRGAYVDPILTHPHNSAMDLWHMQHYHNRNGAPFVTGDPDDFVRDYCKRMRMRHFYSPMVNLCNILSKEIYLENMQEWVLFCRGTDSGDYGDTDHDSLHSYYVASYIPVADRLSYWNALGRALGEIQGVGRLVISIVQMVISIVSPFVGKLVSQIMQTGMETLKKIVQGITDIISDIKQYFSIAIRAFRDIYDTVENYLATYLSQVAKYYDDYFALPISTIYPISDMPFYDDAKAWFENQKSGLVDDCTTKLNNMNATMNQALAFDAIDALPELSNMVSYDVDEMDAYGKFVRNVEEIVIYVPKGV